MARLVFGRLSEAWKGEASDFTPLLAEQLDAVGAEIGLDLASVGAAEVATMGDRRIDIVAEGADGSEFVIENQYGRGDHDHLTRGLAYAVARQARGLIVIAEEHRDEFRALAQYLNALAERDPEHGIAVWLVEARAVRIGGSEWAPLFSAVAEPNSFTADVERSKQAARPGSLEEFWGQFEDDAALSAAKAVVARWAEAGYRRRLGPKHVVLEAPGPSAGGTRTVLLVYSDGHVMVPFGAYAGQNSGIPIESLTTDAFRAEADALFGFAGSETMAKTVVGWVNPERVDDLLDFSVRVARAYAAALDE